MRAEKVFDILGAVLPDAEAFARRCRNGNEAWCLNARPPATIHPLEKKLPTRGRMAALDLKLDRKADFLAVDLQFFFYGFHVVSNLSNRIGYFFF